MGAFGNLSSLTSTSAFLVLKPVTPAGISVFLLIVVCITLFDSHLPNGLVSGN